MEILLPDYLAINALDHPAASAVSKDALNRFIPPSQFTRAFRGTDLHSKGRYSARSLESELWQLFSERGLHSTANVRDPLWRQFARYEAPYEFDADRDVFIRQMRYLRDHDVDVEPMLDAASSMKLIRNWDWSRRRYLPILVCAFYLKRIHPRLYEVLSKRINTSLDQFCRARHFDSHGSYLFRRETALDLLSYAVTMSIIIESWEQFFPESAQRGRPRGQAGLDEWHDLFVHAIYDSVTRQLIDAAKQDTSGLFPVSQVHEFDPTSHNKATVTGAIVTAHTGRSLTANAVNRAVQRSKKNPRLLDTLHERWAEFTGYSRPDLP